MLRFRFVVICVVHLSLKAAANLESGAAINVIDIYRNNLKRMDSIIDPQQSPCHDFFRHSCGNFGNVFSTTGELAMPPPQLTNHEDRTRFFEQHKGDFSTPTGKLLHQLYDSCKDRRRGDVLRGPAPTLWQRMLLEIPFLRSDRPFYQQWPFLRHQWLQLNETYDVDWIAMAAKFAAHGVSTLFHVFFADRTIYIGPTTRAAACLSEEAMAADVSAMMGPGRHGQIASVVAYELSVLCRLLNGQMRLASGDQDEQHSGEIIIDDTIATYFQHFFAILNFTETEFGDARKIPIDIERLSEQLSVVQATEPRILFNYILWNAYDQLKYEDCFALTSEWRQLLHAEYWSWHVFEPYFSRDVAMASYLLYNTRFYRQRQHILMTREWRKVLRPSKSERRDYNVKRVLHQYGQDQLNAQKLAQIYASQFDDQATGFRFYAELLKLRLAQLRHSFFSVPVDEEDVNEPSYFMERFLNFNQLIVYQPLYHYFATEGLDLWLQSGILYSSDGFYTAWDCLERQLLLHDDVDEERVPSDGDSKQAVNLYYPRLNAAEVRHLFEFYTGFVEALGDYKFWLESEFFAFVEDVVMANYAMDSERAMFYAVAQQYCQRNDHYYSLLINRSFRNMPQFQAAFHCAQGEPMNPTVKCMVKQCESGA